MDSIRYPYAMVGKFMNRTTAKQLWPIIKAYGDGKDVEFKFAGGYKWLSLDDPHWNDENEYRIKPEPREFRLYLQPRTGHVTLTPLPGEIEVIKVREVLE